MIWGVAIGVGIAVALGVTLKSVTLGLAVGVPVGIVFAVIFSRRYLIKTNQAEAKSSQTPKSDLEQKYEEALETIAGGKSWETIIAKSVLDKKRNPVLRFFAFLKDNLAAIASLAIAISGIGFGILQYEIGTWQKDREITIAKVEALEKLLPSLTSQNHDERRYALSALFTLYSDDSSSTDNKELRALLEQIGQVGDAETVEAIAGKLKDDAALKKRAAELFAVRAEQHRRDAAAAEDQNKTKAQQELDRKQQNFDKATQYLKAARMDAQKAMSIDPENANAKYQFGRVLMDADNDFTGAIEKFNEVIILIDKKQHSTEDNEIYVRSYLNLLQCLYKPNKKITAAVCQAYNLTKTKYREFGAGEIDIKGEELEEVVKGCS